MIGASGLGLLSTRFVLFNFWARHVGLAEAASLSQDCLTRITHTWGSWVEGGTREPVDSMPSKVRLDKQKLYFIFDKFFLKSSINILTLD